MLPALDGGGVERGTLEVAEALVAHGHRSIVLSAGGRLVGRLVAGGSEHVTLPLGRKSPLTLRHLPRLRRLLAAGRVDILHARSRMPAWIGYLAWRGMDRKTRPRLVTTVHGLYSVNRYSAIMTRAERVIAVSRTVEEYVTNRYPNIDPARIRIIPRGVDERDFPYGFRPAKEWRTRWDAEHPELEGRFIITLPGRLRRLKGHRELLDLVDAVARAGIPVHGLIVGGSGSGSGSYATALRREAARRVLPVTFTGHREDMREIYALSDLVVSLSSRPESFGRTVLEALRIGTPVVGYAHGGVGEILAVMFPEGQIELGDTRGLIEKVVALHRRRRRPPRSLAFPREEMLARTIALYAELANCR